MDRIMRKTSAHIVAPENYQFGYSSEDMHRITEETTPFLNLDKLREEERSTEKTRRKIYKLILSKCHSKIRRTNNTTDFRECNFDVPIFLPGFPVYSVEEAKQFVLEQLHKNGIYAQDQGTTRIYISWRDEDVNYDQYQVTSQKMAPKDNVYKVGISPLDERFQATKKKREAKIWNNDENKVSLYQYDTRFGDMVPVNASKMNKFGGKKEEKKPSYMRNRDRYQQRSSGNRRDDESEYSKGDRGGRYGRRRDNDIIDLDQHYFSDDDHHHPPMYDHRYH